MVNLYTSRDTRPQLIDIDIPEAIDLGAGDAALIFSATAQDNIGIEHVAFHFAWDIIYNYGAIAS